MEYLAECSWSEWYIRHGKTIVEEINPLFSFSLPIHIIDEMGFDGFLGEGVEKLANFESLVEFEVCENERSTQVFVRFSQIKQHILSHQPSIQGGPSQINNSQDIREEVAIR